MRPNHARSGLPTIVASANTRIGTHDCLWTSNRVVAANDEYVVQPPRKPLEQKSRSPMSCGRRSNTLVANRPMTNEPVALMTMRAQGVLSACDSHPRSTAQRAKVPRRPPAKTARMWRAGTCALRFASSSGSNEVSLTPSRRYLTSDHQRGY